jgi:hypothetical protein
MERNLGAPRVSKSSLDENGLLVSTETGTCSICDKVLLTSKYMLGTSSSSTNYDVNRSYNISYYFEYI